MLHVQGSGKMVTVRKFVELLGSVRDGVSGYGASAREYDSLRFLGQCITK